MTKSYLNFKNRINFLTGGILIVWSLFVFRLSQIQIVNATEKTQGLRQEKIEGNRGNIFDVNNISITQNLTFYQIAVRSEELTNKETFIKDISKCTGVDVDTYSKKMNDRSYVILEKKTRKDCEYLKSKYPKSLEIKKDYKRYYPQQELFGQIVGFTDTDDKGIAGLEYQYNEYLKGKSAYVPFKINGLQERIYDPTLKNEGPEDGYDIYLTLNKEYQAILREELLKQVEETNAIGGMGIIINPQDGRVLSMVSVPDFNPNLQRDFEDAYKRNRIVSDSIEPGSTFKIVTIASALEEGISRLDEYNVQGPYDFYGDGTKMVEDHEPHTVLTLEEILAFSSNIGTVKLAQELGKENIYQKAKELGFSSKTGLDLYGEGGVILRNTKDWTASSMHSIPIGYEIAVTPVHIAMAYASIANGGFLLKPYVLDKVIRNDEKIIYGKRKVKKRVLSQNDSEILRNMLFETVNTGSGKKAYLEGWNVAGKTGTAKKLIEGEYSDSKHLSSFIGFFPKDNPQLLALIIIDEPTMVNNQFWGSVSAAPVFKSVMNRIINIDSDIKVVNKGERKNIVEKLKKSDQVLIQKNVELVVVPNVKDKSVREAIELFKKRGIKPQIKGSGKIISQSLEPGTKVPKNSICKLEAHI
ncbi:MAG: penicillin-binding protein [Candidatus Neomarinimicrobiota bacterium]|nr:penicillin-binding protein [Candidatus Neomarinimicrobiota bacterium]